MPTETASDKPAEKTSEKPAETTSEKPAETTSDKPAETASDKNEKNQPDQPNQASRMKIPWSSFPPRLIMACEEGKKPEPRDRRAMIRIVMSTNMSSDASKTLSRNDLRLIAGKIVAKYPRSFADRINGEIVGDGTKTLLQQLEHRKENESRSQTPPSQKNLKRKNAASSDDEVKVTELDSYGCVKGRWEGKMEGADEEEVQEEKRKLLIKEYEHSPDNWNKHNVDTWMEATFPLQRKDINSSDLTVAAVLDRWPFLVEQRWFSQHFKLLTGKDLEANKWATRAERLYTYLKCKSSQQLGDTLKSIKDEMELTQNKMPIIDHLSTMLAAYFGEKETTLIRKYQDVSILNTVKLKSRHIPI